VNLVINGQDFLTTVLVSQEPLIRLTQEPEFLRSNCRTLPDMGGATGVPITGGLEFFVPVVFGRTVRLPAHSKATAPRSCDGRPALDDFMRLRR
jgi:hypothetical protein